MISENKIIIISSVDSEDTAIKIAQILLDNYLAACINIIPKVHSIYRWKGEITDDRESILLIKTVDEHFSGVESILNKHSGYEVSEVLSFDIKDGSEPYLKWVEENLTRK